MNLSDFRKNLPNIVKKKVEDSVLNRMPIDLKNEFLSAGGKLNFNKDTNSLQITDGPDELLARVKKAIQDGGSHSG